jgi:signal transduction histidine kinase/CheY-like chemotaxis protein
MDRLAVGSDGGCCGYAAWSKARTVVADIRVDPRWATYRELAARAGLTACWSEPILSQGGAVLGTFGVYHRQVHEPSEIELATVTEAAKLAGIAIERKRADDALRESQKMEALGTLAGGIAHDFNNILGAILGNVALARSEAGAEGQTHLDHIQRSAVRARHLVQQILAFGRRQPRQACAQPLRPLVEEAVGLLRSTLPAGLRLLTRLPAGEVCALADATQIQQLLLNLCTNAWHAIGDGPGEIEVGLEALAEAGPEAVQARLAPGPVAHLWVRDSGKGMDEATRTRIFEPFFTTKPVGVGTGLGLAVVHGIVSEHRGTVTVESAPGRGATFHIYLPATAAAPADAASSALPPAAAAEPDRSAAARRILLVDDDEVMRLTGAGLLECHGHQVTTAAGAREALEAVRRARGAFDLVVCDYNMPESSGVEVARELARIEAGLPVVIYSGYIDAELRARAGEVGVVALLHKENAAEELEPTVRRVLARRDG